MNIIFSGCCKTGLVRTANEDAVLMQASDTGALFLVADGVGGRPHGEVVSGLLRDRYGQWWEERFLPHNRAMDFPAALHELKSVLLRANQEVVDQFGELTSGSTLALLFLFQGNYMCLSVGDSRVYCARRLSFQQLTYDDTSTNSGENYRKNRFAQGKLMTAVGFRATPEFQMRTDVIRSGSRFLLCSDGVYRFVDPKKLRRMVLFSGANPECLVEGLSKEVERNGAKDNYSMIYICFTE